MTDGLACGHDHTHHLDAQDEDVPSAATSNVTDLRRARQRGRASIRGLEEAILAYLAARNVQRILDQPDGAQRLNRELTELASEHLREELVNWLEERRRTTMSRAARAALDTMQQTLPASVDRDDLAGRPTFSNGDRDLDRLLRQLDVGLLSGTETGDMVGGDSLAQQTGDRLTRQLRLGVDLDEPVTAAPDRPSLTKRVEMVLTQGSDAELREELGVTGQTMRTKAEMIAHDSVQHAYNTEAQKRYLDNGFRFVRYDATLDTRTSALCRRLDGVVIDLLETPWLVPGNHPHCRSGIAPVLEPDDGAIGRADISDSFLGTIMDTASYRPPVLGEDDFNPTPLTRQLGQS